MAPKGDARDTELQRADWPEPAIERFVNVAYHAPACDHVGRCDMECGEAQLTGAVQYAREMVGISAPKPAGPITLDELAPDDVSELERRRAERISEQRRRVTEAHHFAHAIEQQHRRGGSGISAGAVQSAHDILAEQRELLRRLAGSAPLGTDGRTPKLDAAAVQLVIDALRRAGKPANATAAARLIWGDATRAEAARSQRRRRS